MSFILSIEFLVGYAVFLQFIATIEYAVLTLKGQVAPNRVSWALWATTGITASFAMWSQGFNLAGVVIFASGFFPLLVLICSFVGKGIWDIKKFDYVCGAFSVAAILLWILTKNPLLAVIFAIIADSLASLPTLRKMLLAPDTEAIATYMAGGIMAAISAVSIENWTPVEYLFPLYLLGVCILLVLFYYWQRLLYFFR